jgi:hypothetical protein
MVNGRLCNASSRFVTKKVGHIPKTAATNIDAMRRQIVAHFFLSH